MTAILGGGKPEDQGESRRAGGCGAFIAAPAWCYDGGDVQGFTLNTFVYWSGHEAGGDEKNQPLKFGAYVDWKEMTEDIVMTSLERGQKPRLRAGFREDGVHR